MFSVTTLKSKKSLETRKQILRQSFFGPGGKLIDPKTVPPPPTEPAPSTPGPHQTTPPTTTAVHRRIHNAAARDQTTTTVNLFTPNNSGHLRSTVTGVIVGRVYRSEDEVTVTLRKDSGGDITVRGALPIYDTGLKFTMEVNQTWDKGKQIYRFQRLCGNSVVALPVGGLEFRKILQDRLKLQPAIATEVALSVAEGFIQNRVTQNDLEKLRSSEIPIAHIHDNFKDKIWYEPLSEVWGKLKYKFYPDLLMFWDYEELSRLSLADLGELYKRFREHPIDFFLTDYRTSRLPPIPESKLSLLKDCIGFEFTDEMCALVKFFNAVSAKVMGTKCLALTKLELETIATESVPAQYPVLRLALSTKYGLLKAVYEKNLEEDRYLRNGSLMRFYRTRDYTHLRLMKIHLGRILSRPADCLEPLEGINTGGLLPEQYTAVYNLVSKTNFVLVSGDGGTGKTLTSTFVYELYGARRCLAVAAYTGLATRNQRTMSKNVNARGMTIALVIESIRRGTPSGLKIASNTEVLIVDEIGVVTLEDFSMLLRLLPNLKKIFATGDVKQCRPVAAGRVLDGFLGSWANTDNIVYLTVNKRVDAGSRMLIDNYDAFLKGDFDSIRFTSDLLDDTIPFKVIKRQNYPDSLGNRSSLMMRELRQIYLWLSVQEEDVSQVRIITHTHADVNDLNAAWMTLRQSGRPYDSNSKILRVGDLVRFTKPFVQQFKGKRKIIPEHLKCDIICTNNVAQIEEIYDISSTASAAVAYKNRVNVSSTSAPFVSTDMVRVLKFSDSTKLNLRDYPLSNIVPGHATTILSSIGHETKYIILWVPPWQRYFYRELFYTAITRAKNGVILIMNISEDYDIARSDMATIWKNVPEPTENVIAAYVPKPSEDGKFYVTETTELTDQFDDYFFDPMSNFERQMLEDTMADYEYACPVVGDALLERDTERILKHVVAIQKQKQQQPNQINQSNQSSSDSEESRDSQWSHMEDFQPSQQEYQQYSNISIESTKTFDSAVPTEKNATPPVPKRHFAFIGESKRSKQRHSNTSEDSIESKAKRLKRSSTLEHLSVENSRTQLDEELELLNTDEGKSNPFSLLSDSRQLKRQKSNRILDD